MKVRRANTSADNYCWWKLVKLGIVRAADAAALILLGTGRPSQKCSDVLDFMSLTVMLIASLSYYVCSLKLECWAGSTCGSVGFHPVLSYTWEYWGCVSRCYMVWCFVHVTFILAWMYDPSLYCNGQRVENISLYLMLLFVDSYHKATCGVSFQYMNMLRHEIAI